MINNLAIRMITLAVGLGALPSALSVCPEGEIGIGLGTHPSGLSYGVIYANNCGIIDSRGPLDGTFCGTNYADGASVQCDSAQEANTAQTPDGSRWANCYRKAGTCGKENGSDQHVLFCCPRALP
ncbi:hypothetical protein JB92DRAFT_3094697 [Gautieria morchelliformis]|nr:hypothetical protein JB92DRAFT_3094697 [Gautieria morchelliformis]